MKALILKYWDRLRSSFWFVPGAMACLAVTLAYSAVALDEAGSDDWASRLGWSYSGGAEGASLPARHDRRFDDDDRRYGLLAHTRRAVARLVQLGPRLLSNFMRDTANQVVLGTFIATFLYCLLVLRTIRRADEIAFVPHLSVTLGVLFAIVSLGVLIYFIHHVSISIQADEIVARVGKELENGIDRLYPGHLGSPGEVALPPAFALEAQPVGAAADGYLQMIDADALIEIACQEDLVLRLERRPGHYLVQDQALVMVWPGNRVTKVLRDKINAAFVLGNHRTASQDVEFSVDQLVEIAVRALSAGINDPFTAIVCVDRLGSALSRLARRDMPSAFNNLIGKEVCAWWRRDRPSTE